MADPSMTGTAGQALGAPPSREYQSKEGRAVKVKGPLFRGGACALSPTLRCGRRALLAASSLARFSRSTWSRSLCVRTQVAAAR